MKFLVIATHENKENNMTIECSTYNEMLKYKMKCKKQGYSVTTRIEGENR